MIGLYRQTILSRASGTKKLYIKKDLYIEKKSLPLSILYTVYYILIDSKFFDCCKRTLYGAPFILPLSRLTATFTIYYILPLYSFNLTILYLPVCPFKLFILLNPSSTVFSIYLFYYIEPLFINIL
jgi:hypothetical protein